MFDILDTVRSVSVSVKNGLVTITGFPYGSFAKFLAKEYHTHMFLEKMVERTFTRSIVFYEFFVPEFIYLLNKAAEKKAINATRANEIIDALYQDTWFHQSLTEVLSAVDPKNWDKQINPNIRPLPHQREFVCDVYWQKKTQYSLNGYLLAFDQGLGKSLTSLFLASGLNKKHIIIICPLSTVRNVWVDEVNRAFIIHKRIVTSYDNPKEVNEDTEVLIFNYESIEKFTSPILRNFDPDDTIIIVDECHNFKDIKAQRTQALLSLVQKSECKDVLLMSGTPIKALGVECIPIFSALDDYCTPDVINKLKDLNRMPVIMNELLRNRLGMMMYRRVKADVLQLPEKHEIDLKIKIPDGKLYTLERVKKVCSDYRKERSEYYKAHYKEYEDTWLECLAIYEATIDSDMERYQYDKYRDNVAYIKRYGLSEDTTEMVSDIKAFEVQHIYPTLTGPQRKAFKDATVVIKYVQLKILGEILGRILGQLREEMTTKMIGPEVIKIIQEAEKKTIIFTSFSNSISRAEEICLQNKMRPISVTGANSKNAKEIVDKFRNDDKINPLIASIKAMSTGHTIICANTVIFLNVPFRSVDYEQASDRVYRIGQDCDVYIYKLFLDTGDAPNLSTRMGDIITWSKEQFNIIVGDGDDLDQGTVKDLRKALNQLDITGFVDNTLDNITSIIQKICKPIAGWFSNTFNLIPGDEGFDMSDGHIEDYTGEENGLVPDEPQEEPKLRRITDWPKYQAETDGHVDDYQGEENGLVPDEPEEESHQVIETNMSIDDTTDKDRKADPGFVPEPAERPKDAPQHEDITDKKDIVDTDDDEPLEHETAYAEAVPGLMSYMGADQDNNYTDDTIQTIPIPTKEEDGSEERPVKDLDDKDPHDPEQVDIVIDIEDNRTEERQMKMHSRRQLLLMNLAPIEQYCMSHNLGYGQEGFFANTFTGIVNIVGHILNLFNAGVINGWRDFKRGELTAYSDSNRLTMTRIYTANFYQVEEVEVDTPQGMVGTYSDALNSLCAYMEQLNMLERVVKMLKTVEAVERDMHKQNNQFASIIQDSQRSFNEPILDKLYKDTSKYFTPPRKDGGIFGKLFTNMKEYETVIKKSIDTDTWLRQVASVHSRLEDIQKVVGRIADDAQLLTKPQIESLAKVVRAMAELFDNYGTVCADLLRVQHNLVLVTKTIRKKFGY